MKLTKLVCNFYDFYDFWRILKDLCFYKKKEKNRKIEKFLRGLGPAHNETDPTTRIQLRSKMKHHERLTRI
jgi:hypothetical protein